MTIEPKEMIKFEQSMRKNRRY